MLSCKLHRAAIPGDSHRPRRERIPAGGQRTSRTRAARLCGENLGHTVSPWPPKTWDLRTLSLAALYFHPAMEAARARLAEAEAATMTAGARPNPTLEHCARSSQSLADEPGFCRAHRNRGKARASDSIRPQSDQAAQFDLADAAWKVRSGVRLALLNCLLASRNLDSLRVEEELRRQQVKLLEQRLAVGEIARPEVDRRASSFPKHIWRSPPPKARSPKQRGIGCIHGDSNGSAPGHGFGVGLGWILRPLRSRSRRP
jgi:hypothetical protein